MELLDNFLFELGVSLSDDAKVSIPVNIVTSYEALPTTKLDARIKHCTEEKLREADRINVPVSCHGKFDRYPSPTLPRFDSIFEVRAELDPYAGSTRCVLEHRRSRGSDLPSFGSLRVLRDRCRT